MKAVYKIIMNPNCGSPDAAPGYGFRFEQDEKPHILLVGDDQVAFRFVDPEFGEHEVRQIEIVALPPEAYTDAKLYNWYELVEDNLERRDPADPAHIHIAACMGFATIRLVEDSEPATVPVQDFRVVPLIPPVIDSLGIATA